MVFHYQVGLGLCRLVQEADCCREIAVPEPDSVGLQVSVSPAQW